MSTDTSERPEEVAVQAPGRSGRTRSSVSVVVPCYRYGHYLQDSVGSVLEQEGVDVRVLVVDDASGDGSAEVAQELAQRDPRVEVSVHPSNRGHLQTYNEGLLDWADGDYCVLLSADDMLAPGSLKRATDLMEAHPRAAFAYGNVLWFHEGRPLPAARTRPRGWSVWDGHRWLERRLRHGRSGINSPEVVVRTSAQREVGGYDVRYPHLADTHMWLRLAAHGDVGYLRGVDQAYYRRHGSNMSIAYTPLLTLQQYAEMYDSVLERVADRVPDTERLSAIVRRKLAWEALLTAARAYERGEVAQTPVDELVEFALRTSPEATSLAIHRGLRVRRVIGPDTMPRLRPLLLPVEVARKAQSAWLGLPVWRPLLSSGTWARYRA
ncbi:glycosyltransferase family 2 protein [Phycicoccus ginsengisoli]